MAIYNCDVCFETFDDDWNPCVEHPTDGDLFCCEACASDIEAEEDAEFKKRKAEWLRERGHK